MDASPATLAALGCALAFDREPDVIVSGINPGWNTGVQGYVSSGTMGAARVALDRGFTGIAVSHAPHSPEDKRAIAAATAQVRRLSPRARCRSSSRCWSISTRAEGFAAREPVRLTRPARFTLFEGVRPSNARPSSNGERIDRARPLRQTSSTVLGPTTMRRRRSRPARPRSASPIRSRRSVVARRPVARHRPRVLTRCMMRSEPPLHGGHGRTL